MLSMELAYYGNFNIRGVVNDTSTCSEVQRTHDMSITMYIDYP